MTIMTFEAMLRFRRQYRDGISTYYSGWLHMLSVLAVGLAVICSGCYQWLFTLRSAAFQLSHPTRPLG